eukprot:gene24507-30331_t
MAEYYAGQAAQATDPAAHADQTIHCLDEGWLRVMAVTLDGAFRCSRAAVRIMAEQNTGGAIVNIASTAAVAGNGPVAYCTAKAGIIGMTRAMARELAPRGIRVNAVHPGATETPIYAPLPQEVKDAVAADSVGIRRFPFAVIIVVYQRIVWVGGICGVLGGCGDLVSSVATSDHVGPTTGRYHPWHQRILVNV